MNFPKPSDISARRPLLISALLAVAWIGFAQQPQTPPDPFAEAVSQLESEHPMVRRQGIEKLGRLRDPKAVPALKKALGDENPFVRSAAVDVLGRMRVADASGDIVRMLRADDNPQVRQQAAIALSYLGDRSAIDALVKTLDDSERAVRYAAARTLGNLKAVEAEDKLIALMGDEDDGMRQVAAGALGRLGSPKAAEALYGALEDASVHVRRETVKALGSIRPEDAAAKLKPVLEDADPMVRLHAAAALAKLGDGSGEGATIALLSHEDPSVRTVAANNLGEFGSASRGLPALKKAVGNEKSPGVQQALQYALVRLKSRLGIPDEPEKKEPAPAPKKPGKK